MVEPPIDLLFERAFRGYDTAAVAGLVAEVSPALQSSDARVRQRALDRLQQVQLPVVIRGYARRQVQAYLAWMAEQLAAPPSLG